LVIAIFYSTDISLIALGLAAVGFGVTVFLNAIGVRRVTVYVLVGMGIWLAFLKSGVHPTVAGVLLGLLTPSIAWVKPRALAEVIEDALAHRQVDRDGEIEHHEKPVLGQLETAAREAISPLERLEGALHPWVAFGIMPLFALANAGVAIQADALGHPVALAVAAGLVLGKPVGIVLFSWLAVRLGMASLPTGVNWKVMIGAGCLAGIGFTMSLFIAGLALDGDLLDAGKIGTLLGSAVSALLGSVLLLTFLSQRPGPEPAAGNTGIETRIVEVAHVD
jgi:NhaA family Na+:H+ antiporter